MFSLPHIITKNSHARMGGIGVLQFSNSFPETKNHVYDLGICGCKMSVELDYLNGTISLPYSFFGNDMLISRVRKVLMTLSNYRCLSGSRQWADSI